MRRVMSCTYSIWDIIDDLVMRKVNDSDATKFAKISRYDCHALIQHAFASRHCPNNCCA